MMRTSRMGGGFRHLDGGFQASATERLAFVALGSQEARGPLGVPIADAVLAPASTDGGRLAPPQKTKERFSLT